MSGYEEEHGIQRDTEQRTYARPDLSSFFASMNEIGNSASTSSNQHAQAQASDFAVPITQLINAYAIMQGETEGVTLDESDGIQRRLAEPNPLLESMRERLFDQLQHLVEEKPKGMPQSFIDELDRIPTSKLKKDDRCPICVVPYTDDKYPLVVQLPCHKEHIFDLECIGPWFKLQTTCPMCRTDFQKKKDPIQLVLKDDDEDEGEWDEMYA